MFILFFGQRQYNKMASIDLTNIFFQLRNNYSNSSSNPAFYDQDYSDDTNLRVWRRYIWENFI